MKPKWEDQQPGESTFDYLRRLSHYAALWNTDATHRSTLDSLRICLARRKLCAVSGRRWITPEMT